MVNFVVIAIIILAIFLFFKITSFRYERWWTYLIGILLILLLVSFFSVTKKNDINLSSADGFIGGVKAYFSWLVAFGKNAGSITGQITNIDWNVTNATGGR